jgi:hypothetical protein
MANPLKIESIAVIYEPGQKSRVEGRGKEKFEGGGGGWLKFFQKFL